MVVLLFLVIYQKLNGASSRLFKKEHQEFQTLIPTLQNRKNRQNVLALYLKALLYHGKGNVAQASTAYTELFKLNPPKYVYEGYIKFLFETNQHSTLLSLDEKILEQFPDHWELRLQWAQALLATHKDSRAQAMLEQMLQQYPDNEQIVYYATIAFLKQNKLDQALERLDGFLSNTDLAPKHSLFYFLKSKIYVAQKDTTKALDAIEKSLSLYPNFDKGILFKSLLLEQAGKISEAISGYRRFLDVAPGDQTVEKQLVTLLFSQERYSEALEQLRKIPAESPEHFFDLALIEWKARNCQEALKNINIVLEKNEAFPRAKLLKIEVLLALQKFDEVESFIRTWIQKPDSSEAALQVIIVLAKGQLTSTAVRSLLEEAVKVNASRQRLMALADMYAEQGDIEKAAAQYDALLKFLKPEEQLLTSKIQFQKGHTYFMHQQWKAAESALQKAVACKQVCPAAYNLLAYYYAEHEPSKLGKAMEYVEKALAQESGSAVFLDTKGYILYKQGKLEAAREQFEAALRVSPGDKIIEEHLNLVNAKSVIPG